MEPDTSTRTRQNVVGDEEHEHSHWADVRSHDHYHVSHHHARALGEFEHRAPYHQLEHNHAPLVHAHQKYDEDEERAITTAPPTSMTMTLPWTGEYEQVGRPGQ